MLTANRNRAMYKYNDFDHAFVTSRNAQFREQVNRRISGAVLQLRKGKVDVKIVREELSTVLEL